MTSPTSKPVIDEGALKPVAWRWRSRLSTDPRWTVTDMPTPPSNEYVEVEPLYSHSREESQTGLGDRTDALETELNAVSDAIGSVRFMDPPDGGDVSLSEQVRRMRLLIETLEKALGDVIVADTHQAWTGGAVPEPSHDEFGRCAEIALAALSTPTSSNAAASNSRALPCPHCRGNSSQHEPGCLSPLSQARESERKPKE